MPSIPQSSYVEGAINYAELRAALMNLDQLMTTQAHVINNPLLHKLTKELDPNLILELTFLEFGIL